MADENVNENENETPADEPAAEIAEEAVAEAPVDEPEADAPEAAEEPVAEAPAEEPVAEAPAEEAPVAEEPVEEAPAAEEASRSRPRRPSPTSLRPSPPSPLPRRRPSRPRPRRSPARSRRRSACPGRSAPSGRARSGSRPTERKPIVRLEKPEHERGRRQERQGTVVSDAMEKTIVVKVDVVKAHPKYKKVVRRSVKFHAHDEQSSAKVGDIVRIVETRPLSKTKRWRLAEVVEAAK